MVSVTDVERQNEQSYLFGRREFTRAEHALKKSSGIILVAAGALGWVGAISCFVLASKVTDNDKGTKILLIGLINMIAGMVFGGGGAYLLHNKNDPVSVRV
ncbi:MAG: hypothetical protein KDK40_02755 [Chlamydiia bacterium]|nr:hypothetical protein [Chlamydiia bacterium]